VAYYNDSIATAPERTLAALHALRAGRGLPSFDACLQELLEIARADARPRERAG